MAEISKQALLVANNTDFPNNNAGAITPAVLRSFNTNLIDSTVNQTQYNTNSGSWNVSIGALNTFTASQQPQFTNLNAFTASQLTINSGYNAATQSLSASIATTNTALNQVIAFTGSVNQIASNGIVQGYSTRFYFSGLMTASIVANVDGPIATISLINDNTKIGTSSFNAYTASTNSSISNLNDFTASQTNWNASATASIIALQNFSSSLDATYATDAQLASVSASLVVSIDTKLNTSSFNSYTASVNTLLNGYATTGSNSFNGNQIITGSLLISSSAATDLIVTGAMNITGIITSSGSSGQVAMGNIQMVITSNAQSSSATFGRNNIRQNSGSHGIGIAASPAQSGLVASVTNPSIFIFSGSAELGGYYAPIQFQKGLDYTDGRVTFTTPVVATGSVLGNVVPLTITSQTASMDLSLGNFFTLTLVSGSTTQLTATNIKAGQTINLLITQSTPASGSLTYNSTFKFPNGASYTQTNLDGAKDILSFITFDNSTIYATPVNNLI
jgi:hypothetical protein